MLLVEIEKPENETLATWFSALRTWLDVNHCEPVVFARAGRRLDRLIYRISFDRAAQAHEFSRHFARYVPAIRRATLSERDQLRAVSGAPAQARTARVQIAG
jgi:hypothetical protein